MAKREKTKEGRKKRKEEKEEYMDTNNLAWVKEMQCGQKIVDFCCDTAITVPSWLQLPV